MHGLGQYLANSLSIAAERVSASAGYVSVVAGQWVGRISDAMASADSDEVKATTDEYGNTDKDSVIVEAVNLIFMGTKVNFVQTRADIVMKQAWVREAQAGSSIKADDCPNLGTLTARDIVISRCSIVKAIGRETLLALHCSPVGVLSGGQIFLEDCSHGTVEKSTTMKATRCRNFEIMRSTSKAEIQESKIGTVVSQGVLTITNSVIKVVEMWENANISNSTIDLLIIHKKDHDGRMPTIQLNSSTINDVKSDVACRITYRGVNKVSGKIKKGCS